MIAALTVGATEAFIAVKAGFGPGDRPAARGDGGHGRRTASSPTSRSPGHRPRGVPVRRGEGAARGHRGRRPAAPRLFPPYLHGLFATAPQLGWEASHGPERRRHDGRATPPDGRQPDTRQQRRDAGQRAAWILANGAEWFRVAGHRATRPGTVIVTVVGDVRGAGRGRGRAGRPRWRTVIDGVGGGSAAGRQFKAVFSGVANPVLTAADLDIPLTYEDFEAAGSGLGAGRLHRVRRHRLHGRGGPRSSPASSTSSRAGSARRASWAPAQITGALDRIRAGAGGPRPRPDPGAAADRHRRQPLLPPRAGRRLVSSVLRAFPEEFAEHLDGWCPSAGPGRRAQAGRPRGRRRRLRRRQARKRPDWTYL